MSVTWRQRGACADGDGGCEFRQASAFSHGPLPVTPVELAVGLMSATSGSSAPCLPPFRAHSYPVCSVAMTASVARRCRVRGGCSGAVALIERQGVGPVPGPPGLLASPRARASSWLAAAPPVSSAAALRGRAWCRARSPLTGCPGHGGPGVALPGRVRVGLPCPSFLPDVGAPRADSVGPGTSVSPSPSRSCSRANG